jgi:23S rRNA (pseudouridine1915-N3)-methyltransferase
MIANGQAFSLRILLMTINIYQIARSNKDNFLSIKDDYIKMSRKYANVRVFNLFSKNIIKSQTIGKKEAMRSYSELFIPKLSGLNIALVVDAKEVNSFEFSEFFQTSSLVNFFIGGPHGLEDKFIKMCDISLSLSKMTYAHKIANIVLLEQIFRSLCIINNHPYHKI